MQMSNPSPRQLARAVFARVISRSFHGLRIKARRHTITPDRLLKSFGHDSRSRSEFVAAFKRSLHEHFFLSDMNRKEFYINLMTSIGGFDPIMDDADMVHENKYRTLGSGVYSFGDKMDWHLDFKTGKRWPLEFYSGIDVVNQGERKKEKGERGREKETRSKEHGTQDSAPRTLNPEHCDVKVPWEVNRFHQAIWLGRAYWISHSEAHTDKFKALVDDWIENNPVGYGINWHTSMEVAIRAMNLIVGFLFFAGSTRIDDDFVMRFLCVLYEHGVHIRHNLELSFRNGNHYISDLVGLVYIGILFCDTEEGKRWVNFASRELEKEIMGQVYPDGTHYEKSISYQRLVTELFAAAYVLLTLNNFRISAGFHERLEKMFTFLASATAQNGRAPNVGDGDDGRVFKMKSEVDFNDHRDLISLGAALFGRGDLKAAAPDFSELALLLLGGEGFERFSAIQSDPAAAKSVIFKEGGFAFLKTNRDSCSLRFGDVGRSGRGGHGHNDVLSFTVSGKGPFLVDRGTFCYSCDPALRDRLRSTYSHSTAVVDGYEQAEFSGLWSVREDRTRPEVVRWSSNDEQDIAEARHHAYERLAMPITHKRKITFNKRQRTFLIEDGFTGKGEHVIDLMFHFAPGLKVTDLGRSFVALEGEEFALVKFMSKGTRGYDFKLEKWEHSPSYGVLQEAVTAHVRMTIGASLTIETFIFLLSNIDDVNHIMNRFQ